MSSSQSIINSIESQTNCPWDPPTWSAHPDGRIEPVPITRSLVSCRFRFHTFDERCWAVDYSVQEYSRKFTLSSILFPDYYQFFFLLLWLPARLDSRKEEEEERVAGEREKKRTGALPPAVRSEWKPLAFPFSQLAYTCLIRIQDEVI